MGEGDDVRIETERLVLRPPRGEDFEGWAAFMADEEAMPEGWPGPEIGYGIVRSRWGRGYATEGSAAAIDWSFEHLGWTEVIDEWRSRGPVA